MSTEQRNKLQLLLDYLITHPRTVKDQTRVERLLATVIADPSAGLGQSTCWPLGDVIIALQIPTDAAVWTTDTDFYPLIEGLGLQRYTPTFSIAS